MTRCRDQVRSPSLPDRSAEIGLWRLGHHMFATRAARQSLDQKTPSQAAVAAIGPALQAPQWPQPSACWARRQGMVLLSCAGLGYPLIAVRPELPVRVAPSVCVASSVLVVLCACCAARPSTAQHTQHNRALGRWQLPWRSPVRFVVMLMSTFKYSWQPPARCKLIDPCKSATATASRLIVH